MMIFLAVYTVAGILICWLAKDHSKDKGVNRKIV